MLRPVLAPVNPPQPRASSPLDNSHSQDLLFIQATMKIIRDRRLFERYQTVFLVLQGYPYRLVGCDVRQALDDWLMTRSLRLDVALEIPFGRSLLGSALAGQGTSVMPQSATTHHDPQRMIVRPIADGPSRQVVAVA